MTAASSSGAGDEASSGAPPLPPPAHLGPLPPARPAVDGVQVRSGIAFAAIPGIRPLELDLWMPADAPHPVPAVVFLHGGGFRLGSRHSAGPAFAGASPNPFERIAQHGIAVASVDYRLSGEAQWPAQIHDVKAAVRWLRARSAELGIDGERIAAWGESAGGHLAEMLALTGDSAELEGGVGISGSSSSVVAAAAWYAPSDLGAVATDSGADPLDPSTREAQLLGAATGSVPELAAAASPVSYVEAAVRLPPLLLLHGLDDRMIPCVQTERLAKALLDAGADVEVHLYPGANHMWLGAPEAATDALNRTLAFLQSQLLPSERNTL